LQQYQQSHPAEHTVLSEQPGEFRMSNATKTKSFFPRYFAHPRSSARDWIHQPELQIGFGDDIAIGYVFFLKAFREISPRIHIQEGKDDKETYSYKDCNP